MTTTAPKNNNKQPYLQNKNNKKTKKSIDFKYNTQ
jgi:hypothetical protein